MIVSSTAFENNGIIPMKYTGFGISEKSNRNELLDAMRGHILSETKLFGKYKRVH